jgi:hypothetical protein
MRTALCKGLTTATTPAPTCCHFQTGGLFGLLTELAVRKVEEVCEKVEEVLVKVGQTEGVKEGGTDGRCCFCDCKCGGQGREHEDGQVVV